MSWLSKLVGGNTLKLAAIAAAGYAGKEYMFGSSYTDPMSLETTFTGGNFAADTFNKYNITPFSGTAFGQSTVGQAITSVGSFLNLDKQAGLMEVVGGLSGENCIGLEYNCFVVLDLNCVFSWGFRSR